jgi:hypothetical protein
MRRRRNKTGWKTKEKRRIPIKKRDVEDSGAAVEMEKQIKALAEQVFIGEIVLQSKIAKRAFERLTATQDHIEVWCEIQLILMAAGNVSKIFWPQEKKYRARGAYLRKLLNVAKRNLLSDRKFRNHFEHYDDRIETWFEENPSAVYMDLAIDPFKSVLGNFPVNYHRAYDPSTQTLTFRGETFDLVAVLNALEEIRLKCGQFALP